MNPIDWILDFIYEIAVIAIGWLPSSPFQTEQFESGLNTFSGIMGNINYFIPIGTMLTIFTAYLACVLLWYGIRWIMRIAQYID